MAAANGRIKKIINCAISSEKGEMRAAIKPKTVIGATNGAATILATIEMGEI